MKKSIRRFVAAFSTTLALPLALPQQAEAATATGAVVVSATVLSHCIILATPMVFGNYGNSTTDAASSIAVTCTVGTEWTLALDAGIGANASVASRKMIGPLSQSQLSYSLYSDAARSSVWGNTAGTNTVAGVGTGLPDLKDVYGRIPEKQYAATGIYADTVTATLTY